MIFDVLISECIVATTILLAVNQVYDNLNIGVHILVAVLFEIYFYFKYNNSSKNTRANATPGSWVIVLIPCIMLQSGHQNAKGIMSASLMALIVTLFGVDCFNDRIVLFGIYLFTLFVEIDLNFMSSFLFISFLSHEFLMSFSGSLTIGESILLSQTILYFLTKYPFFIIVFLSCYSIEHFKMHFSFESISRIILLVICMYLGLFKLSLIVFTSDALILQFSWIYSLFTVANIFLIILWAPLCLLSIGVVYAYSNEQNIAEHVSLTASGDCPDNGLGVVKHSPFRIRKLFHLVAGFVYCTGITVSSELLSVAAAGVFVAFLLIEWVRRRGPLTVSSALNSALDQFRDSRDTGEIIFTPIALLLGLSLPVWNFGQPFFDSRTAWAGVVTIALGDSVAALVGRAYGGLLKWPFTHRTVIGSLASFVCQLILLTWISSVTEQPLSTCLIPLTASVITEAFSEQIDNLVVPLVFMAFLKKPSNHVIHLYY